MPDKMPDRMPEDMSDRMPEDLLVRKCINVMVGITRSKVILRLRPAAALRTVAPFSGTMPAHKHQSGTSTPTAVPFSETLQRHQQPSSKAHEARRQRRQRPKLQRTRRSDSSSLQRPAATPTPKPRSAGCPPAAALHPARAPAPNSNTQTNNFRCTAMKTIWLRSPTILTPLEPHYASIRPQ